MLDGCSDCNITFDNFQYTDGCPLCNAMARIFKAETAVIKLEKKLDCYENKNSIYQKELIIGLVEKWKQITIKISEESEAINGK